MRNITPAAAPKTEVPRLRVVVVEDHVMFADYMAWVLRGRLGMEVCGRAVDARGGLRLVEAERPDLVIVDLTLAQGHGLELLKDMARLPDKPKALVVSGHDESVYAARALDAGAMGYLMKTQGTAALIDAVRCVLAGNTYLSREATTHLLHHRRSKSPLAGLTDREVQVLEGVGRGRNAKQIAAFLGIDTGTVETYRNRLRAKLGMACMEALREFAYQWVRFGEPVPAQLNGPAMAARPRVVKAPPGASPQGPSEAAP